MSRHKRELLDHVITCGRDVISCCDDSTLTDAREIRDALQAAYNTAHGYRAVFSVRERWLGDRMYGPSYGFVMNPPEARR